MKQFNYFQIFDEDGNTAIVQSYIEDTKEYVENIFTDGTPEMESYAYELGFRDWWDKDLDEDCCCDGNCNGCELNTEIEDDNMDGFTYSESNERSHYTYSFYSSNKDLTKEVMSCIVRK